MIFTYFAVILLFVASTQVAGPTNWFDQVEYVIIYVILELKTFYQNLQY